MVSLHRPNINFSTLLHRTGAGDNFLYNCKKKSKQKQLRIYHYRYHYMKKVNLAKFVLQRLWANLCLQLCSSIIKPTHGYNLRRYIIVLFGGLRGKADRVVCTKSKVGRNFKTNRTASSTARTAS